MILDTVKSDITAVQKKSIRSLGRVPIMRFYLIPVKAIKNVDVI